MRLEFTEGLKGSVRDNPQYVRNLKGWLNDLVAIDYDGVAVLYNEEDDYGDTVEKKRYFYDLEQYIDDEDDLVALQGYQEELADELNWLNKPLDKVLYDHKRGTNSYVVRLHQGMKEKLLTTSDLRAVKAAVEPMDGSDPRSTFELRYRDQNLTWTSADEDSINRSRLRRVRIFARIVEKSKEEAGHIFHPRVFVDSQLEDSGLLKIAVQIDDDLVDKYRTKIVHTIQYLKGQMGYMGTMDHEMI